MDYLNTTYYTLSTISQVLAAFIALSGVFFIYKRQEINSIISFEVENLKFYIHTRPVVSIGFDYSYLVSIENEFEKMLRIKTYSSLEEQISKLILNETTKSLAFHVAIGNSTKRLLFLLNSKKVLRKYTLASVIVGVLTILISVSVLSLTDLLTTLVSRWLVGISITLTFISILSMTYVVIVSLKEK